jgi:hypothetical protein
MMPFAAGQRKSPLTIPSSPGSGISARMPAATGEWGSDLDLIAVVTSGGERFDRRALAWDVTALPVPAEILIYTEAEWRDLERQGGRFAEMLTRDTVWVFSR